MKKMVTTLLVLTSILATTNLFASASTQGTSLLSIAISTSGDDVDKQILDARDDAAIYLATDGEILSARLQNAIVIARRAKGYGHSEESDLDIITDIASLE